MIRSHFNPTKLLKEHIQDVKDASQAILAKHTTQIKKIVENWLELTILFHDLGKASNEFQIYISNPIKYKGSKTAKAHTPLSLYWWLNYSFEKQLEPQAILAIATAVWRHHNTFPNYDTDILYCLNQYEDTLIDQLKDYPVAQINNEFGLCLNKTLEIGQEFKFFRQNKATIYSENKLELAIFRLSVQLLFSILLEADKAFLALDDSYEKIYITPRKYNFPKNIIEQFIPKPKKGIDYIRTDLRTNILKQSLNNINIVSLPTGLGKTLIGMEWCLKHRQIKNMTRKVILVLPFLSIIDQTAKIYKELINLAGYNDGILEYHSLADRNYIVGDDADEEELNKANNSLDYLTETWQEPFIITTFDQFLNSLLSSENKYLMRFHNLTDALIIMDEIQALPVKLWQPLSIAMKALSEKFNTKFLIMSATQPKFILEAQELVTNPEEIFKKQKRYTFIINHRKELFLEEFIELCIKKLDTEWQNKRVLLVFNTRACARTVLDNLEKSYKEYPIYFLSADVIPKERLEQIEEIKKCIDNKSPCLVIATQCIEAGVDIDMEVVVRDFAPLDSLIQVAGRCNRNGIKERCIIEVVKLKNTQGKIFCDMIYDKVLLGQTIDCLKNKDEILEEEIYPLVTNYYEKLSMFMNTGAEYEENWLKWKETLPVQTLLRGDETQNKFNFLVTSEDKPDKTKNEIPILEALEYTMAIEDKWQKKRAIRALKGRIAKLTISLWAKPNLLPPKIARQLGSWWVLNDELYITRKGLNTKKMDQESTFLIF